MTRTANFKGQSFLAIQKSAKFMAFYREAGTTDNGQYLITEHRSEAAARKGSWQNADMKKIWIYQGYAPIA